MINWLERYEEQTGGDVLAIAHNGNLSNGIMFPLEAQYDGRRFDTDYVTNRIKWEPLYEITQIKGDGETHPFLSPDDEFADYETWDKGNLDLSVAKSSNMLASEYGREALKRGLEIEAALGTNPYKFGLIGSTDSHTALATAQEDNFFGKLHRVRAEPDTYGSRFDLGPRGHARRVAAGRFGPRSRLGHRELSNGPLRRDGAEGGLRDHGIETSGSVLRWLGIHGAGHEQPPARFHRIREGCPYGRRPDGSAIRSIGPDLHGLFAA